MLKTVSAITNAIGALNYKGTWNASTNTPALASGVGTKGDYYVVNVAGNTTLDGISNWGIGDWAVYNGTAWQRVEGGADLNGVNLSVSGTSTFSGLTASTALALNASKEVESVTNTGTGSNVLATSPTLVTPTLGAATATSINKVALTSPANGSTLTIADGKTLTANNSLALSGTDSTTMTFPTSSATIARTDAAQTFTGSQTFSDVTNFFATTSTPSNPVSGNKHLPFGDVVLENINNKTVGISPVQLTKNGSYGGMAFITAIQPGAGAPYNAIVIWTANQSATIVSGSGGFAGGATAVFTLGGPYNGALLMNLSNVVWGDATVSGFAITTNRY